MSDVIEGELAPKMESAIRYYVQVRRTTPNLPWRFEGEYDLDACQVVATEWLESGWDVRIQMEITSKITQQVPLVGVA